MQQLGLLVSCVLPVGSSQMAYPALRVPRHWGIKRRLRLEAWTFGASLPHKYTLCRNLCLTCGTQAQASRQAFVTNLLMPQKCTRVFI